MESLFPADGLLLFYKYPLILAEEFPKNGSLGRFDDYAWLEGVIDAAGTFDPKTNSIKIGPRLFDLMSNVQRMAIGYGFCVTMCKVDSIPELGNIYELTMSSGKTSLNSLETNMGRRLRGEINLKIKSIYGVIFVQRGCLRLLSIRAMPLSIALKFPSWIRRKRIPII